MATNLYQILDISSQATTDDIRKAYKKRALQTHPDRISPNATPEDKAHAGEQFRLVNHAYEVLSDPEKRKVFDLHGVYPAPVPPPAEPGNRPYPNSGFPHHRGRGSESRYWSAPDTRFNDTSPSFPGATFTDPFKLFDEFFRQFERDPFFSDPLSDPFFSSPFHSNSAWTSRPNHGHSLFSDVFSLIPPPLFLNPPVLRSRSSQHRPEALFRGESSSRFIGGNGRWKSESTYSVTTNKGTETIHKRRDWNGDEHVTKTYPDGRQSYRINGIKQPSGQAIAGDSMNQPALPPPPPYSSVSPWGSNVSDAGGSRTTSRHRHMQHNDSPPRTHREDSARRKRHRY